MISFMCEKHLAIYKKEQEEYAASIGMTVTELIMDRHATMMWVMFGNNSIFSGDVFDTCPDCKLVGLSNRGVIEELDSPKDWLFHPILDKD